MVTRTDDLGQGHTDLTVFYFTDELHSTIFNEKLSIKDVIKEMKQKSNNSKCQTDFCRRMAAFANDGK